MSILLDLMRDLLRGARPKASEDSDLQQGFIPRLDDKMQRDMILRRAMGVFLRSPQVCAHPESDTLIRLIYGWGNELWSAWPEYLAASVTQALSSSGPILECGTGLSTLLIGAIAKRRGIPHYAFEHMPAWAAEVRTHLDRYRADTVVCCAPLKDYGDFEWYDPPLQSLPPSFSLVVCDGPPGDTRGGRRGLIPVLGKRFKLGCVILLDDAHRLKVQKIAEEWGAVLGASFQTVGSFKPYIRMDVGDPRGS
jgi:hypothetical protein